MLILTRKLGESITIGDDIKVTVLGVYGRQVRLGVEAPIKVVVHREEVYLKVKSEKREQQEMIVVTASSEAPPKILTSAPHRKRRNWGTLFR